MRITRFSRGALLRLLLLSWAVGLLSGAGCQSNDTGGVVLPPLVIRANRPVDEAFVYDGADSLQLDLSVVFIRGSGPDEARLSLYPPPLGSGDITLSSTGRTWTWNDVDFSAAQGAYFWLIDGPDIPFPKVVRIRTGPSALSGVGFSGTLSSSNPTQLPLDGALIFAISPAAGFNPLDPSTFLGIQPLAVAEVDSSGEPGQRNFRASYLPLDQPFYVLAILDTTDDAVYDPTVDAWGYRETPSRDGPEIIRALPEVVPDRDPHDYRADVDFVLFPATVVKSRAENASVSPR